MGAALKFKTTALGRQAGELARIKVLRGPDFGSTFVVTGPRATIGRDEGCDVVISDLKASRRHAEVFLTPSGWEVRDAGSANGILVNGQQAQNGRLGPGVTFSVGETVLELVASQDGTRALVAPVRDIAQVQAEQAAFLAQRDKVRAIAGGGGGQGFKLPGFGAPAAAGGAPGAAGGRDPKKLMLVGLVGLAAAMFIMDGGENNGAKSRKKPRTDAEKALDLAAYLPTDPSAPVAKTTDIFFRNGFREYTQGNYLRAKQQFEVVLQMQPQHAMALLYMQNCDNRIKEEVASHLEIGKRSLVSGKLKDAKGHYEAVLRLLYRSTDEASLTEAKDQLAKINAELATMKLSDGGGG